MPIKTVLIVDDEPDLRELLSETLRRMELHVYEASDLRSAIALLAKRRYDLCLTDLRLTDGSGIDLVNHIQTHYAQLPVAVITAYGNMEIAVEALKKGAFDFVAKPINLKILRDLVNKALSLSQVDTSGNESTEYSDRFIGISPAVVNLRNQIGKLARSQAPVLISGESGSGKELVARLIHEQSPRKNAGFIPVNCGAIPTELMESEFFGYKKGSFTGALTDKPGLFQAAHGGTLFLDEVGDLPINMQVKLLRAIQEKAIKPVGELKEIAVDVRILSATHLDLPNLIKLGKFRQDLFYRINVIEIQVPSLADRPEDVPLLVDKLLLSLSKAQNSAKKTISAEATSRLQEYSFPGNIRELENILERAYTLCEGNEIQLTDLQLATSEQIKKPQASEGRLDDMLNNVERIQIIEALDKTHWNRTAAAKLLGITFRALRYRLKKYGIE